MNHKLNIAPISFSSDHIIIGKINYEGNEQYRQLREEYKNKYVFRYNINERKIDNVPILPGLTPLGTSDEVPIENNLPLICSAVRWVIASCLVNTRKILRFNPIIFWGKKTDLLEQTLQDLNIETILDDVHVFIKHFIDIRIFMSKGNNPISYPGLIIDLNTSNVIETNLQLLMQRGFLLERKYICIRDRNPNKSKDLYPSLKLIGKVKAVDAEWAFLDESYGIEKVQLKNSLIEPTQANFEEIIRMFYGSKSELILNKLRELRSNYTTAVNMLNKIEDVLAGLRKLSNYSIGNIQITLGNLLEQHDPNFPNYISTSRPVLLFGPQGRNTTGYSDKGIKDFGPYKYMQHEKNEPQIAVICLSSMKAQVEQFMESFRSGFSEDAWSNAQNSYQNTRENPFPNGFVGKYRLGRVNFIYEEVEKDTAEAYKISINRLLERQRHKYPDLAIIQISQHHKNLLGAENPYFVSKSCFMSIGIPVQAISIEKINDRPYNIPWTLNNFSLSCYAKIGGTPWVISTIKPTSRELVIGMGYTEVYENRTSKVRLVGITTIFQGDGKYLVWGITREVEFENYEQALLETLKNTIYYVSQENDWQEGDNVRLIFHVYKKLKNKEIMAIKALVSSLIEKKYHIEYAFLDLSSEHPYHLIDLEQQGVQYWSYIEKKNKYKGKGVPLRETAILLDSQKAIIQLAGPNELKTDQQGLPNPLLIELHPSSDLVDLTYLVRQVYHFTYLSWRSYFPSTEPITIMYPKMIAKMLGSLRSIPDWNSRSVSLGPLRNSKWFL